VSEEWYQTALFKVRRKVPKKLTQKLETLGPEDYLAEQLDVREIPYERQFKFNPRRQVRADFLIKGTRLLVEVDGGTWMKEKKAHNSGEGYVYDRVRDAEALLLGYVVLRVVPRQVNSYQALQWIQQLMLMTKE
jgi:very-short-patch-repair endonuclease